MQSTLIQSLFDCVVLDPVIVPLKADLQAFACSSKNHDNDHSLVPIQEARSDDDAPGIPSSEECTHPTKVGSMNGWSFQLLIMINDNGNIIVIFREAPTTCIDKQGDLV
jgi:hypothetical protein